MAEEHTLSSPAFDQFLSHSNDKVCDKSTTAVVVGTFPPLSVMCKVC